jgi:hypothetical protein
MVRRAALPMQRRGGNTMAYGGDDFANRSFHMKEGIGAHLFLPGGTTARSRGGVSPTSAESGCNTPVLL